MGDHARPRIPARHRKPGMPARAMAATAVAATGTATAGVLILAGHASAAPVTPAAFSHAAGQASTTTTTEENVTIHQVNTRLQMHLDHLRHLAHLRHLELARQEKAQHVQVTSEAPGYDGIYSATQVEALWRSVGGASWAAPTAACIVAHESSGNPRAISPTDDWGLFQVNASWGSAMASLNPVANAAAAVRISDDGTNWEAWTTAPDCGV